MDANICQSCASPLSNTEDYGKLADGSTSRDYCAACMQNGELYGGSNMKMEDMISICLPYVIASGKYANEAEARAGMSELFASLKRWASII